MFPTGSLIVATLPRILRLSETLLSPVRLPRASDCWLSAITGRGPTLAPFPSRQCSVRANLHPHRLGQLETGCADSFKPVPSREHLCLAEQTVRI